MAEKHDILEKLKITTTERDIAKQDLKEMTLSSISLRLGKEIFAN